MKQYYVTSKPDEKGCHQVHSEDCKYIPYPLNRAVLGIHASSEQALAEAKRYYPESNECPYCCGKSSSQSINIGKMHDKIIDKSKEFVE